MIEHLANSISLVMIRHLEMLIVGNAIIGAVEGLLIAKLFKAPIARSIVLLIVANYASMWFGAILFGLAESPNPIPDRLFEQPLNSVAWIVPICAAIALLASLVLEWPFCFLAMPPGSHRFRRSVLATLVAQLTTYTCLGPFYFSGTNTLGSDVAVAPAIDLNASIERAQIWFIDAADADVCSIGINRKGLVRQVEAGLTRRHDVLGIQSTLGEVNGSRWQLVAGSSYRTEDLIVRSDMIGDARPFLSDAGNGEAWPVLLDGWALGIDGVADFRAPSERAWQLRPRGNSGIEVTNTETRESYRVTFDTVFASWWGRCITVLPTDVAVFELGQQVCVLDIRKRTIAFIVRGRGPVVVLSDQ